MMPISKRTEHIYTRSVFPSILAELLFVLLPLLVIALITLEGGTSTREILGAREWSIGTSVLFGQGLVKFAAGIAIEKTPARKDVIVLVVSGVVVLGLAPALVVLSLVVMTAQPGTLLIITQLLLFLLAVIAFCVLGSLGHELQAPVDATP